MFSKKVWLIFILQIVMYAFVLQEGEGFKYLYNASASARQISHFIFLIAFFITGCIGWINFSEGWVIKLWLFFYIAVFVAISVRNVIYYLLKVPLVGEGIFMGGLREFCTSALPFGICMILVYVKRDLYKAKNK